MSTLFDALQETHQAFVAEQPIFFVATAAPGARINLSPKGQDSLRVLAPDRLIWLNLTGSGNETAGHLKQDERMTVMWCSFGVRPLILRAYGLARAVHRNDADWSELAGQFPDDYAARQIYDMSVSSVQTSCGYAVPRMDLVQHRDTLAKWSDDRGPDGVRKYWRDKNATTIDGIPTGIEAGNL